MGDLFSVYLNEEEKLTNRLRNAMVGLPALNTQIQSGDVIGGTIVHPPEDADDANNFPTSFSSQSLPVPTQRRDPHINIHGGGKSGTSRKSKRNKPKGLTKNASGKY